MRESCCIYLRKSRADLEAEGRGEQETLARHEAALLDLAGREQLTVTGIYREIVSGETLAARPVMQRLLREVEEGLWAGVLVMDVDRLARGDSVDQGIIAQTFRYSGAKIHTPVKTYDPGNEFDEEFFEFGLFMSRREYKIINRRLQRGRLASVREGKYVGSRAPYGYRRAKLERQKGYTLEPVEEQAATVKLIYGWYVYGVEGVRVGPGAIAARLASMGIGPHTGEHWTAASVREILGNPVYAGKLRWNFRPVQRRMAGGKLVSSRPRSAECELVRGLHPAIVDEGLWSSAQTLLQENSMPKTSRSHPVRNPLAGLIVCGVCGRRMVRKPYRSGARDSLVCTTPECTNVSSTVEAVERQLLESLRRWLGEGEVILPAPEGEDESNAAWLEQLYKNLRQAEGQEKRIHDLLEKGIYDDETFLSRREELAGRIEALRAHIAQAEASSQRMSGGAQGSGCTVPAAVNLLDCYEQAREPAQKNALLKELIQKAVYEKEAGSRWQPHGFVLHIYPRLNPETHQN